MENGNLEEEEILGEVEKAFFLGGVAAFGEPVGVGEAFADEEMGFVEHTDEAEDILDGEARFGKLLLEEAEEIAGGFFPVKLGDEKMFDRLEAEVLEFDGVFDDEAEIPVEELGADDEVGAKRGDGAVGGFRSDGNAVIFGFVFGHGFSEL